MLRALVAGSTAGHPPGDRIAVDNVAGHEIRGRDDPTAAVAARRGQVEGQLLPCVLMIDTVAARCRAATFTVASTLAGRAPGSTRQFVTSITVFDATT